MNHATRIRNGRILTLIERAIVAITVAAMIATMALTLIGPANANQQAALTPDGAASPPAAVISSAEYNPSRR